MEERIDKIVEWITQKVEDAGARGVVFGLSGGIDSAVVAGLCKRAFPETSLGIIMPCHSSDEDEKHARLVAESLDLKIEKVDLTDTYDCFLKSANIENANSLAKANIKPRLRMTNLYYFAQTYNYLVVGPTNKSEFTIGYFTKHGDSGVDILPIADFVKAEIWEMAEYLEIPDIIIEKIPSAGLWDNQTDEEEMGFSYDLLDAYILEKDIDEEIAEKIDRLESRSSHKKLYPPIYRE